MINIRPEVEIIIYCARIKIEPRDAARIKTLVNGKINWGYLFKSARQHHITPLLYRHLNAICREDVPETTMNHLRNQFHYTAGYNLFLTGELIKLLGLLESHGIIAIPIKGPVLSELVYGKVSFREFDDLDILIQEQHVLKAKDLLINQGYQSYLQQLSPAQERAHLRFFHEWSFKRPDGNLYIDLHWDILPGARSSLLDSQRLWQKFEKVSFAGSIIYTFSPEYLLLFLCMHGAKPVHTWRRLSWICDVAELIRSYQDINWGYVMDQARKIASERMLFIGLFLASNLLGAPLPEYVLKRIQADPVAITLAKQAKQRLFQKVDAPSEIYEDNRFYLKALDRLQDKIRYCLLRTLTPTSEDWGTALSFPAPLYYLIRPFRLLRKHLRKIV